MLWFPKKDPKPSSPPAQPPVAAHENQPPARGQPFVTVAEQVLPRRPLAVGVPGQSRRGHLRDRILDRCAPDERYEARDAHPDTGSSAEPRTAAGSAYRRRVSRVNLAWTIGIRAVRCDLARPARPIGFRRWTSDIVAGLLTRSRPAGEHLSGSSPVVAPCSAAPDVRSTFGPTR